MPPNALRSKPEAPPYAASLERRLKRFASGRSFISYLETRDFALELRDWLDDVETHVMRADPKAGWKLIDRFIRADERILGRADDSDGAIGDAFRHACSLWQRAAAALPADPAWVERVYELHAGNDYARAMRSSTKLDLSFPSSIFAVSPTSTSGKLGRRRATRTTIGLSAPRPQWDRSPAF